ncbi:MAG TPA: hypothetical protein HA306_00365 [Methanosarcina sp.]|nr:hypothetical protein [Methanosarcina sp.]
MIGKQFNINSNVLTSNMKGSNNTIVINGKSYRGNSVSISGDGEVIIDGIKQDSVIGKISVTLNGDTDSIELESGEVVANKELIKTLLTNVALILWGACLGTTLMRFVGTYAASNSFKEAVLRSAPIFLFFNGLIIIALAAAFAIIKLSFWVERR